MFPGIPGVDEILGWFVDEAAGSVFDALVSWMAKGLAVLIEWIWTTLDSATTPRITEPWFARDLLGPIVLLAVAVTVAMMLASGIQAALAGRPEQILDAFKQGAWSLVATALAVTVMDILLGVVDEASAAVWATARTDLQRLLEGVIKVMSVGAVGGMGFLAVLMMLFMYMALIGLAIALAMRNALIYVTAAMAPLVFASSVLPMFRESARKIVHLAVSLIVSKLAIVITLTLAVKMMANATNIEPTGDQLQDGVGALGVLFAGVVCFAVASITPLVLYKMMPTVEGAVIGAGIAGGWGRGAMSGMYAASTAKNIGGSISRLAKDPVPGQGGPAGPAGGQGSPGSNGSGGGPPGSPGGGPATGPVAGGTGSATVTGGSAGNSAGAGSSAGAGGAGAGAAGAGAAAGAVAVPVALATAGVNAFKGAVNKIGSSADTTSTAAAPSSPPAPPPSSGSPSTRAVPKTGKEG